MLLCIMFMDYIVYTTLININIKTKSSAPKFICCLQKFQARRNLFNNQLEACNNPPKNKNKYVDID